MTQSKDPWTLIAAVTFGTGLGLTPTGVAAFLIGGLVDDRGFNEVEAGILTTVELLAIAGSAVVAAPFMARLSVVRVAICGALLSGLAQLGSAPIESFWGLVAVRISAGVGEGLALAAATAAIAAARNPDRVYGYLMTVMLGFSAALYPALAASIDATSIAGGFALLGTLTLLGLPALRWLAHASRAVATTASQQRPLPRGELVLLLALIGCLGLGAGPVFSFLERIGVNIGLAASSIGAAFSIGQLGAMGGGVLAGAVGARFGRRGPVALGLAALGAACLGFGFVSGFVGYAALLMLFFVAYVFAQVALFATVAILDPSGRVGPAALGWFMLLVAVGPALGGVLVTAGSYSAPGWFGLGVYALGTLLVLLYGGSLDRLGATSTEQPTFQHEITSSQGA